MIYDAEGVKDAEGVRDAEDVEDAKDVIDSGFRITVDCSLSALPQQLCHIIAYRMRFHHTMLNITLFANIIKTALTAWMDSSPGPLYQMHVSAGTVDPRCYPVRGNRQ